MSASRPSPVNDRQVRDRLAMDGGDAGRRAKKQRAVEQARAGAASSNDFVSCTKAQPKIFPSATFAMLAHGDGKSLFTGARGVAAHASPIAL